MKKQLTIGSEIDHHFVVDESMFPTFNSQTVHPVCSTYHLVKEIEWTSRKFVLIVMSSDEEGVGTKVTINHLAPALKGEEVKIHAVVDFFDGRELICSYEARVKNRIIAKGETGQKIVKKEKLVRLLSSLGG